MGIVNRGKQKAVPIKPSLSDYNYGNSVLIGYFKNKPKSLSGSRIIQETIKSETGEEIECYVQVLSILKYKTIEEYLENYKDELLKDGLVKIEVYKKDSIDIFPSLF